MNTPNSTRFKEAVVALLRAAGLDPNDDELCGTPARVAKLWQDEFLSGYQMQPAEILANRSSADQPGMVIVRNLSCHGLCPHHLVPFQGLASIAYVPNRDVVGFGQLAELTHCFCKRLILQEDATQLIVDALVRELGLASAACAIRARHLCLSLPEGRDDRSEIITYRACGEFEGDNEVRNLLLGQQSRD